MKTLVLYHAHCSDGFMSAYIASLVLGTGEDVEYLAVNYNEPLPDVTGKSVFILDFSYKPEVLIPASETAHSIVMLDHHKSAMEDWNKKDTATTFLIDRHNDTLDVRIDMELSGVGLTCRYWDKELQEIENRNEINYSLLRAVADAVQDRDLWLFKQDNTRIICAAMSLVKNTFADYNNLFASGTMDELLIQGATVLKRNQIIHESIVSRATLVTFQDDTIPLLNCNKEFASEVGNLLCKQYPTLPFSASFEIVKSELIVSLRSTDTGKDVSKIARLYGGGGHRNAAGFKAKASDYDKLFYSCSEIEREYINTWTSSS